MSEKPVALAHEAIHEKVEEILKNEPLGKILDVPSGEGALALRLKNLGFDVFCADLYPQIFKLEGVENRQANLDENLPYDDKSFDYIVCVEGLEHIENPANAIREFSRLLKQNGTLVVSVPNIMNIEERLKWLFNGYTSHFKPLSNQALADISREFGGMEEIALHINPIGYSEVRYLLEKYGFELKETTFDKTKKNSWAYLPIVMLIKLASKFTSEKKRQNRWTNELNSKEVLLGGNTLIFKARKL
jgi:ubiquinone/menaquinone biosynthesis C-methylase UbiE